MKLEDAKKLQNVFKLNLNEKSRGRNKSEKLKSALENIRLIYESRESVIELFNDYWSIISDAKCKKIQGKEIPSMLAHVANIANHEVFDHSNLKILCLKQMLQRSPIALAQVKADGTSKNLLN